MRGEVDFLNDTVWEWRPDGHHLHLMECQGEQVNEMAMKAIGNGFDARVIVLEGEQCKSFASLLKEFKERFFFPDYFGYNFNALDECLSDLEWLEAEKYLVVIRDIDLVLSKDPGAFNDFILIMEATVKEWNQGRQYGAQSNLPKPFDVVFHCENNLLVNEERLKSSGMKDLNVLSAPL